MRNLVIAIVVLAVLGLGVFLLVRNNNTSKTNSSSQTTTTTDNSTSNTTPTTNTNTTQPASDAVTITYSDNGFSPATSTLKAGGKLTVTNSSSSALTFNSDPHPSHTANSELNIGAISAGQSKTVTLTNTGAWVYHNHLDSSQKGNITVQ